MRTGQAAFDDRPVGVFDSGVGGLSILRELRAVLPHEDLLYLADQARVPYGERGIEEVRDLSLAAARWLLAAGAKLVVVACNTASAAALHTMRRLLPDTPFVGMEAAIKPAARATASGVVAVLATRATFQAELFANLLDRFATGIRVVTLACPELVLLVEAGDTDSPACQAAVTQALAPLAGQGADQVVLGCTHFPFLRRAIRAAVGPGVGIIDPSPAVARQTVRVLTERGLRRAAGVPGRTRLLTTGDAGALGRVAARLLGDGASGASVEAIVVPQVERQAREVG